jgi:cysteinyl-tRNA synthetase
MMRLYDTASGEIVPLSLRNPGEVSMYVCGPTVDNLPHLGHGRFALVFDVLRRYLEFSGLEVVHISNITDIDDKIINRASKEHREPSDVAEEFEAAWWAAMDSLGVERPTNSPHATDYVERMVDLIGALAAKEMAYETPDGVYLDAGKVDGYGLLAHQPLDSLRAGARIETHGEKRSPLDFVLWKKAKPGEPSWDSPWGPGRPGWHTECVVMSLDLLGEGFDIHGGAIDLIFPHHENERAQAVALGIDFAHHWVHNGWVMVEGEKMSKSLGNFTSLSDLLEHHDPRAYRLLVLRSHYRSPIEVTPSTIEDAEKALERLDAMARRFDVGGYLSTWSGAPRSYDEGAVSLFHSAMDDDLDTPRALASVFELVTRANVRADSGRLDEAQILADTAALICAAMGLDLVDDSTRTDHGTLVQSLVEQRDRARKERDWSSADLIRDELVARGFVVEDSPAGTVVRRR